MRDELAALAILVAGGAAALLAGGEDGVERPIVIAHRGASGERPEHTLEAYRLAIEQGADFVEPDLVATKDGVLVCRHENEISGTTDVASRPEFSARRVTKTIDGVSVTGWFTEDFTLAELKTLRARERLPHLRSTAFDGRFAIPAFEEVLELVASVNARPDRRGRPLGVYPETKHPPDRRGRPLGVYPETKHPSYFEGLGLPLGEPLVEALRRHALDSPRGPVFIQSFEVGNLRRLASMTRAPLVQLIAAEGRPWDLTLGRSARAYADMVRPEGLREIARYARGIGVEKSLVVPRDAQGRSLPPTSLVRDAHAAGLLVHVWTLRAENAFLPVERRRGEAPSARGDLAGELRLFVAAGVDGLFTDHPAPAVAARDARAAPTSPD